MSQISTPLTRLLGIKTPIVSAAMAGVSGGKLAEQVTLAGGFGFMGAGYDGVENLKTELAGVRSRIGGQNDAVLPIGVGFLVWKINQMGEQGRALVQTALEHHVRAVWFAFGEGTGEWVRYVRSFDLTLGLEKEKRTLVFVQVNSVEEAVLAVEEWGVDVLIVQGIEAGGHGSGNAPPLLTLLPSVLNAKSSTIPIIAAGGLANGSHLAAVLTMGASGAVFGTRFAATSESKYSPAQRDVLVNSESGDTIRTRAFDWVRGVQAGWPEDVDGRAVWNDTVREVEGVVDAARGGNGPRGEVRSANKDDGDLLRDVKNKYDQATRQGDPSRLIVWSGTGVSLINKVSDAADVVREIHQEAVACIQLAASLVVD